MQDTERVRLLMKRISDAWRGGHVEDLNECFHANIVILGPEHQVWGQGREACVASYRDFVRGAVVQEYHETDPTIHVWGTTAVATFGWEMTYAIDGKVSSEVGTDLFVLEKEAESWRAVCRGVKFGPKAR